MNVEASLVHYLLVPGPLFGYRTTIVAASGFLETFQKLADMALGTRGERKNHASFFLLCLLDC